MAFVTEQEECDPSLEFRLAAINLDYDNQYILISSVFAPFHASLEFYDRP
jgi:hypothetical protein